MMKQMKLPIFLCPQDRLPPSSCNHSLSSGNSSSSSSSYSPPSVLPTKPKSKEKRPLPPPPLGVEQNEVMRKKRKVAKSSSSTSTSAVPPLSPNSLHGMQLKVRYADLLFKTLKTNLQQSRSDPVTVQRELEELKRTQLEDKKKLDAHLREEQRLAHLEAKRKQEEIEKERQRVEQERRERQRIKERELEEKKRVEAKLREAQMKRERLVREKMEAAAACEQSYCCTLIELGVLTECDHALSWGFWGGKRQPPLEKLGLFLKKDYETNFRDVELEEGEINEELEKADILWSRNR